MSVIERLKEKAAGSNYTYLKILQKYKFDSNQMHYVFEGNEDLSFYYNFIRTISNEYLTYVSLGKKQSLEVYQKINWAKYDKKRILIFIDRDYSRLLGEEEVNDVNVYETTFYSIENYIVSPNILRQLINEILHFHDGEVMPKLIEKYEQAYRSYARQIQPIICWILLARSNSLKVNLKNIDLAKLFSVDENLNLTTSGINRIAYLERVTGVTTPTTGFTVCKKWYEKINVLTDCKFYLRGKFEMWFLVTFFRMMNNYLIAQYAHNSRVKTDIHYGNAVEILGPRIQIPPRLEEFVKGIKTA